MTDRDHTNHILRRGSSTEIFPSRHLAEYGGEGGWRDDMIYSLLQLVKSIKEERREGADLLLWSPS